jgi:hypothetical protein
LRGAEASDSYEVRDAACPLSTRGGGQRLTGRRPVGRCRAGKREARRAAQDAWKGGAGGKRRRTADPIMTVRPPPLLARGFDVRSKDRGSLRRGWWRERLPRAAC